MRFFISAGEPSGDLHGANLAKAIRARQPSADLFGFGGAIMRRAGVDLRFPLAESAVMGLVGAVKLVPQLSHVLDRITAEWHLRRPNAVVLIDYPGFHWHVAARAKVMDIPVISFVPPQIWAWASYRVKRIRANFDHVLCSLPFEEQWYRARGVHHAHYIGHPYFDELSQRKLDAAFIERHRKANQPTVAILPGSRKHEIDDNMTLLIGAVRALHMQMPDVRFLFACYREDHRQQIARRLQNERLPAEAVVSKTAEVISVADACIAVSGSVGLELLYHRIPSVVVYRTAPFNMLMVRLLMKARFISIVNLLADEEVFPEFLSSQVDAARPAEHILRWLQDAAARRETVSKLDLLCEKAAKPGACAAAAEYLLSNYAEGSLAAA